MKDDHRRPAWRDLGYAAAWGTAVAAWWLLIYGGADVITSLHQRRVRVHLDFELGIPFIPAVVAFYLSPFVLLSTVPFVLRRRVEVRAMALTMMVVIAASGVGFLLIPAEPAWPQPDELGRWATPFRFADWINMRYNMAPSLHVGLMLLCVDVFGRRVTRLRALSLWLWGVAVCASTLFTHQHHLVDVITGALVALAGSRLLFPRLLRR